MRIEEIYKALGLEDPGAFHVGAVTRNKKRINELADYQRLEVYTRGTGRTTRLVVTALAAAIEGKRVLFQAHSLWMKRHVESLFVEYAKTINHQEMVERLVTGEYTGLHNTETFTDTI